MVLIACVVNILTRPSCLAPAKAHWGWTSVPALRAYTAAANGDVGMTPHVKLNVQIPAECMARDFFFFNQLLLN